MDHIIEQSSSFIHTVNPTNTMQFIHPCIELSCVFLRLTDLLSGYMRTNVKSLPRTTPLLSTSGSISSWRHPLHTGVVCCAVPLWMLTHCTKTYYSLHQGLIRYFLRLPMQISWWCVPRIPLQALDQKSSNSTDQTNKVDCRPWVTCAAKVKT